MTGLSRLVLVRHGETVGNSSIRYYGRTDVALSELGRAQIRAARDAIIERLHLTKFTNVFTSPLHRAREGARIIVGPEVRPIEVPEFVEVDFGRFEGLTADEIRTRFPDDYAGWNRDRLAVDYTYPGGENRRAFQTRVARGIDRIAPMLADAASSEVTSLIVAHRGVIRVITEHLADVRPEIELGSIHVLIRAGEEAWRAACLDFTAHLEALG